MPLELLNTVGTFTTVAIVSATAIAALVQLRHLRTGNQINAMLSIAENSFGEAFSAALLLADRRLPTALEDPGFRDYSAALVNDATPPEVSPDYVEIRRATILVGNRCESVGILVKNGIVDKKLFLDQYSQIIIGAWNRLEILTAFHRESTGNRAMWENFELLTVLSQDWLEQHPSLYPRGVRRLQLHNPWPVAPTRVT